MAVAPDRFDPQWSVYEMDRRGERHDRVWDAVDEAAAASPDLKAELEALLSGMRTAAAPRTGVGPDEVESEAQRAAASTLHAALLEVLAASPAEEVSRIWDNDFGDGATTVFRVPAYLADQRLTPSAAVVNPEWGELSIAPPNLVGTTWHGLVHARVVLSVPARVAACQLLWL
jgi:hypothetical protein